MVTRETIESTIDNSKFIDTYRKEVVQTLKRMHPKWDEDDIINEVNEMLRESLQIPEVTLDNNYTGENRETNVISVFDWALERKPLVAGNGTFYKTQHEAINPVANMLDGFLKQRKATKKEMFKVEDKTSELYRDLDRA